MRHPDQELVKMLREELQAGFGLLAEGIGQTNAKLDQTNARLDQTIVRLDQNTERLERSIVELRSEVCGKLDGISSFLVASERNAERVDGRLFKLEIRMDKIEGKDRPA